MRIDYDEYGCNAEIEGEIQAVLQCSRTANWTGIGFTDLLLGPEGRASLVQQGMQVGLSLKPNHQSFRCSGESYDFRDDNIIVLAPGASVVGTWVGPFRNLTLKIAPETVERMTDLPIARARVQTQFMASHINQVIGPLLMAVSADLGAGCPNGPIVVESVTATLLQICSDPIKPCRRLTPALRSSQAAILREVIAAHLHETLTLQRLADAAGMSVGHLVRAFKASFGVSPYQYILRERVNRALSLMEGGQTSLADIAKAAGFHDSGQMSKTFRRITGRTPRQAARDLQDDGPSVDLGSGFVRHN